YGKPPGFARPLDIASCIALSISARFGIGSGYVSITAFSSAGSFSAAHSRWCQRMLGVSPNALGASSPNLSSPFAIAFLQVRQLARPDFASSITFAMAANLSQVGYVRASGTAILGHHVADRPAQPR